MLNFYEKVAVRLNRLNPELFYSGFALFVGIFILSLLNFNKPGYEVLVMIWVFGLGLYAKIFSPKKSGDGKTLPSAVRASSRAMQIYGLCIFGIWFLGLFAMTLFLAYGYMTDSFIIASADSVK